jgi:hypothetical protein
VASVKISWDGGDVAPVPRFPVSRGDRKKIQTTASVPKKSVSLQGCTPFECAQFCAHSAEKLRPERHPLRGERSALKC